MVERPTYEQLLEENKILKQKVADLEKKLFETIKGMGNIEAKTSKKIPSFVKPNISHGSSRPGRRNGHPGISRKTPNHIDEEIELSLETCPDCGNRLGKSFGERQRYVEDIKPVRTYVRFYKSKKYWCTKCKKQVYAKPKDVIPKCRFGISFMLFVAFQYYALRLTLNKISEGLREMYGIKTTEATLYNSLSRLSGYLGDEFNGIIEGMKVQKKVYADESSWRINGINHWIWDFISDEVALIIIRKSRGSNVPIEILGEDFKGILSSDFWSAYSKLNCRKQKCLVHLLRSIKAIKDDTPTEEESGFCRNLERIIRDSIRLKKRDTPPETARWKKQLLEKRIDRLAVIGYQSGRCRTLAGRVFKHKDELFTFLVEDVNFHNNDAERGLRSSVVKRKISYGNRSHNGARNHEVIMSVMETWKRQDRNFIDYGREYIENQLTCKS